MTVSMKAQEFLSSREAAEIRTELRRMMDDSRYNTRPRYSAVAKGEVLFVDKHLTYLSLHLDVNPSHYMLNLRLITKYN